jgi:putative transposase
MTNAGRWAGVGNPWMAPGPRPPWAGEKSGPNPTDRAKRGVKRSLRTDAQGIPIGLALAGANRHDSKLVRPTLESVPVRRPKPTRKKPQHLCLDKAYYGDPVYDLVTEFGYTVQVLARGAPAQALKRQTRGKVHPWVVERTHSWRNRFRRILLRWEKKPESYLALLHLVCALITYRAIGLPG